MGFLVAQTVSSYAEEKSPIYVETVTAVRSDALLSEIELTGTVVSRRFSGLSSRVDGLVKEVMVDAGSEVKKGDVLLTLDPRFAEIELDLIRAEIEVARVQLRDAERRQEEASRLTDTGAFAKSAADSLDATAEIRAAELKTLQAREVQQLERLNRHQLIAPFDGLIARKATEAGEWVQTGATVFDLVETRDVWFELQMAQEFMAAIPNVEEATVILDPFPENPLSAQVDVVVPVEDPVSRTFITRLSLEDPDSLASPGMSGAAVLRVRPSRSKGVTIPRDAVTRHSDGRATVWTVSDEGGRQVAHSVEVTTAGSLGEAVEVSEGLVGGEQVVVRGNEGLSDEDEVKATTRTTANERDSF